MLALTSEDHVAVLLCFFNVVIPGLRQVQKNPYDDIDAPG